MCCANWQILLWKHNSQITKMRGWGDVRCVMCARTSYGLKLCVLMEWTDTGLDGHECPGWLRGHSAAFFLIRQLYHAAWQNIQRMFDKTSFWSRGGSRLIATGKLLGICGQIITTEWVISVSLCIISTTSGSWLRESFVHLSGTVHYAKWQITSDQPSYKHYVNTLLMSSSPNWCMWQGKHSCGPPRCYWA